MGFVSSILSGGGGSDTYNVGAPPIQQQDLVSQLSALNPQQQQLSQMLMQQAQGNGPNPAQAMLNQATSNNIAQTAGQIASTKGISPALAARLGAQQGAASRQAATGQGAIMGAQQQLGAENTLNSSLLSQQQILQNAQAAQNSAINQGTLGAENINASAAAQNAKTNASGIGGALGGLGAIGGTLLGGPIGGAIAKTALSSLGQWKGGEIPSYSDGTPSVSPSPENPPAANPEITDMMHNVAHNPPGLWDFLKEYMGNSQRAPASINKAMGGKVPAMVSPEEVYIPPEKVLSARKSSNPLEYGEKIPGRAPHPGNDKRNDIIYKPLESGGVVIPNSVTKANSPAAKAKAFMAEIEHNKKAEGGEIKGYNKVLMAKRHLLEAHEALSKAHKAIGKMK